MVKLMRMMLTVFGAALLNKILKGSFWPSTNSYSRNQMNYLNVMQNIMLLLLSRSRLALLIYPAAISTASTIFATFMNSLKRDRAVNDQVIETDEYKIVD